METQALTTRETTLLCGECIVHDRLCDDCAYGESITHEEFLEWLRERDSINLFRGVWYACIATLCGTLILAYVLGLL